MSKSRKTSRTTDTFEWIDGPLPRSLDDGCKYFKGIHIKRNNGEKSFKVHIGNVVFLKSPDLHNPYIALIDSFYEDKSNRKLCKTTWFYRYVNS